MLLTKSKLVFIDSQIENYQILAAGVVSEAEVVILQNKCDGILQISEVLLQKPATEVHLVSHGSPGCLYLGNTQLSLDTLNKYREDLKIWSNQLSIINYQLSILLYGCNVAAGDAGEELITKLQNITGAKIAASTTPTGNAAKGGNWKLEYQTSKFSSKLAFTLNTRHSYAGILEAEDKNTLVPELAEDLADDLPTVTTDLDDYPPGATAKITGKNFDPGETIELQVLHTDGTPNTGGGHEPWQVTDGGAGDLDGLVDGKFQTTWYVNPDDSLNSSFQLTATGLSSGEIATYNFTDADPAIQFFYVPTRAQDLLSAFTAMTPSAATDGIAVPSSPITTTISLSLSTDNTVIYYDHWEDGYETDISQPTQSTTQVWGDNNPSNGIAPGFSVDLLTDDDVIALTNNVPLPRNPATILYDGRDKIGASKAIVVTKTGWAANSSTLLANAAEVYDTSKFGTNFVFPVGQNIDTDTGGSIDEFFEYTGLSITASQNSTTVAIDTNGDGTNEVNTTLDEGEVYFVNGGINAGGTITASKPIQAHLITGNVSENTSNVAGTSTYYASRGYTLYPNSELDNSYFTPVGDSTNNGTEVFLHNPNNALLTINYEYRDASNNLQTSSINVEAKGTYRFALNQKSGYHFFANSNFSAVSVVSSENNTTSVSNNATYDWGHTLIGENNLTPVIAIGYAPGSNDFNPVDGVPDDNSSPVWVTTTADTRIYINYSGDLSQGAFTDINGNKYDKAVDVKKLEEYKVYDPSDRNMTGARIYTLDGTNISAAWGQDPDTAQRGNPAIDLGTAILPLPIATSTKKSDLFTDVNNNGLVDPGDTLEYTINIRNDGVVVLGNVNVSDIVPQGTQYVPNSTKVNGVAIGDDTAGTLFPLNDDGIVNSFDNGLNIGNIPVEGTANVTYRMKINDPYDGSGLGILNSARIDSDQEDLIVRVRTPVEIPTKTKFLYLSGTNDLDRIDPVASNDTTNSQTASIVPSTFNFRDKFSNTNYNSNDGSSNWNGNWVEVNDNNSSTSGDVFVTNFTTANQSGYLAIRDGSVTGVPNIYREANLAGFTSARLAFNFGTFNAIAGDTIVAEVSYNGGTNYTTLETFNGAFTGLNNREYLLNSASLSANTRIRFRITGGYATNRYFLVDDVKITGYSNTKTVRDNFGTAAYNNSNGTNSWNGNWTETGDNGLATTGKINITNGRLRLTDNTPTATPGIYRSVNLAGATKAILSFDFAITTGVDPTDTVVLQVSGDGGTTYKTLETFTGFTDVTAGLRNYNLADTVPLTADTRIRFQVTGGYETSGEIFSVDNLEIAYDTSATFNQAISMKSDFELPAGENVVLTSYVNVSSGTLTSTSDLTAKLTYDSGIVGTFKPTNVTSVGGSNYQITWQGTLDTDTTIPAGQDITLNIANNQPKLNFSVLYDSTTYPSKIELPTKSYIDVAAIEVYDNSYANGGGNLVNAATEGDNLYVRVRVEDPFGDYDVTGLNLSITDSNNGTTPIPTNQVSVVDTAGDGAKIYEYQWTPTTTLGEYQINATAQEGLETGAAQVTDIGSASFTVNDGSVPDVIIGNATAVEGNKLVFDVSLTKASSSDVVLDLIANSTNSNTATSVSDYEISNFEYSLDSGTTWIAAGGANGTQVTIPAANTGIKVRIDSIADNIYESNETFTLAVNNVLSGDVGNTGDTGLGTITNDDSLPAISISDVTLLEGNSSSKQYAFTVSLNNPSSLPVTVNYATANGTATVANNDYTATNGTLTFNPGETTKTINVNVTGDTTVETDETFNLNLSNATNATINDSQGVGTIVNDDSVAVFSINDVTKVETNSGTTAFTFTVTRSGSTTTAVSIDYATANGTATSNSDYASTSGTLNFAAGVTTQTITVNVNGDTTPEANETFFVNLLNPSSGATISDSQGVGTITNDDVGGSVSGTVLRDTNNDDIGDRSLAGVTITLTDTSNNFIATTTTAGDGTYSFNNLTPGNYLVKQTNLPNYIDVSDTDGGNFNQIAVTVTAGGSSTGNNFVDEQVGSLSGTVLKDTNNDNIGDASLAGVTIELLDSSGNPVLDGSNNPITTITNSSGTYSFSNIAPGTYQVREINLSGYQDISDVDGGNPNLITVNVSSGANSPGNDFVDEQLGNITGTVLADTDNNDTGDAGIPGVTLELLNSSGSVIATTTTAANGTYSFNNVAPGNNYQVRETNLAGYQDVSDVDGSDLNLITNINVTAGSTVTGRDFIDEQLGSISGNVTTDTDNNDTGDNPLSGVTITLRNSSDTATVATTTTNASGDYSFNNVAPGSYLIKETDPSGYISVSDGDTVNDGANDNDTNTNTNDNSLAVNLTAGESDTGNNFIDEQLGNISGRVTDIDNNGINNVELQLLDSDGNEIATINTSTDGSYSFNNIAPGNYTVVQVQPTGYSDVSENEGGDDNDNPDNGVANSIAVTLDPGETDSGNDFIEAIDGTEFNGTSNSEAITGTSGGDIITGNEGQDTLAGGGGSDLFVYTKTSDGLDYITDFDTTQDIFDFSDIASNELGVSGDLYTQGYVVATQFGSDTMIQVDFDPSDTLSNFYTKDVIYLQNVNADDIDSSNFIF